MPQPTVSEPVNDTPLTTGLDVISLPTTEPEPVTKLSTPAGRPASSSALTMLSEVMGAALAGFKTTVLPLISAGASFQEGMATGKFQGVMRPTVPSGSRTVYSRVRPNSDGVVSPLSRRPSPAK